MTFIALILVAVASGFVTHSVAVGFMVFGSGIFVVQLINDILRTFK